MFHHINLPNHIKNETTVEIREPIGSKQLNQKEKIDSKEV